MIKLNNTLSIKKRDLLIDSLSSVSLNFIKSYCKKNHIDNEVEQKFYNTILSMEYGFKIFVMHKPDKKYFEDIKRFYQDSIEKWSTTFNCNNCGGILYYNSAAKQIFEILYKKMKIVDQLNLIATNKRGNTKDYLLSSFTNEAINAHDKNIIQIISLYNHLCTNDTYKKLVNDNYELNYSGKVSKNESRLMDIHKANFQYDDIIKKFNNKIIYIDFWASWCTPCLAEMPYSAKLHDQLKENKNIVMLYISMDNDFNSWVREEKTKAFSGENSYILSNAFKDNLSKSLNISSIPRYLIINKNGKLINKDAPRPSDINTYKLLKKLAN